jgi:hypothetical protein
MNKIQLKNNKTTKDVRLDRLVNFDRRSRAYPVTAIITAKKPRSYTWRTGPTLDQGNRGSCVGHGIVHELAARPAKAKVGSIDAIQIYEAAQKIDPWPGENYEGTSVLAGVKVAQGDGWFEEYRWAFGLEDLILGVGRNGPAVVGTNWYSNMSKPDDRGYIHAYGSIIGGHCYLVMAVDVKRKRFKIQNSWGKSWGDNGHAWVSYNSMKKLLKGRGEACFFQKRHRKAKK